MGRKKNVQVIKSRGEVSTHGMTIKEWQRTPKQLLSEYCQNNKRPRALYKRAGCPDGRFRTRVVLPDPKGVAEKAIVMVTTENYETLVESQHSTALLVLKTLDGARQHDRRLPEPYRTVWLNMSGSTSSNAAASTTTSSSKKKEQPKVEMLPCEYCDKTFKKEHALATHVKREHQADIAAALKAAEVAALLQEKEGVEETSASTAAAKTTDFDDSPFDFSDRPRTTTTAPAPKPPTFSISAGNKFSSQYERRRHNETRKETKRAAKRQHDIYKQSNPYATVFMSEEQRKFAENVIKAYQDDEEKPSKMTKESGLESTKAFLALAKLGFREKDARNAIMQCGPDLDQHTYLDWLCLYAPEEYLPKGYDPRGKQMEVYKTKSTTGGTVLEACLPLLNETISVEKKSVEEGTELVEIFDVYSEFARLHATVEWPVQQESNAEEDDELDQLREDELLALSSMFEEGELFSETGLAVENHVVDRHMIRMSKLEGVPGQSFLEVITVASSSGGLAAYPYQPAIVLFHNPALNRHINAHMMLELAKHAHSLRSSPQLYEIWDLSRSLLPSLIEKRPDFAFPKQVVAMSTTAVTSGRKKTATKKKQRPPTRNRKVHDNSKEMEEELNRKREHNDTYKKMQENRAKLPAYRESGQILGAIRNNQVVLISGETGSGKTTQIPQFILDDAVLNGRGGLVNIVCTQPRRLAAIGVANRVNDEQCGGSIGGVIGYQIRLENKTSPKTRLSFVTTGILLRRLQSDKLLDGVTHVIVDEVHERNVDTDFLLSILKDLLPRRPDLKVLLMSATMDAMVFCEYFATRSVVKIPGFVHPVQDIFLESIVSKLNFPLNRDVKEQVALGQLETYTNFDLLGRLVKYIDETNPTNDGSILVFMSGAAEISKAILAINRNANGARFVVLPLHGALSGKDQSRVFRRAPKGMRKVVVSTNVAETSVTIDDVVFVIDSGKLKETQYDPVNRMSMLVEVWVSRNSARQRRGRAGRVRPGQCFKLYTKYRHDDHFKQSQLPEIHRVPLEQLILQVLSSNLGQPEVFMNTLMEPPPTVAVTEAVKLLKDVGAAQYQGNVVDVTPLGKHLSRLPMDVRIGKMLIYGSLLHCSDQVLTIAAGLSVRNPFVSPPDKRDEANEAKKELLGVENVNLTQSDHVCLLYAYEKWNQLKTERERRAFAERYYLHHQCLSEIRNLKRDLRRTLEDIGFDGSSSVATIGSRVLSKEAVALIRASLCAGLYPNVINIRKPNQKFTETASGAVAMAPEAHKLRMMIRKEESEEGESSGKKFPLERVFIHPASINFFQREYPCPWMVYREKVKTSKVFIRDCTVVPPYSILMFGGEIAVQHDRGTLTVDGWITFTAQARVGVLVRELRKLLDRLMTKKINDPALDIANTDVLAAIKKLLIGGGFEF